MAATASPLISTADLARLHSLEVVARIIVEGLRTGTHRSPHKGHSIEFADHRAYVPGDDLRHLDWKVLGRSDRLVLKRYEAETDLGCTLVVDGSASMGYQGERASVSKFRYASMIAASVAYLVIDERDRAGLVLFHEQAVSEFRPATQGQLVRICRALEGHTPAQGTDISKGLEHIIAPASQRGLVILLSDCLADPAELERTIDRLAHRGHDLALVWVLDPDEIDLAVATVSKFEGLEGDGELTAEPRALRTAYLEQVQAHRLALQTMCRKRKMAFIEAPTSEPLHVPLNRLLVALHEERR
jgi:uncharacterized protein (DUF58 family)